ncbi:MAG: NAD+ synthase [Bacteroidales bacterium]|nr:NAD+ synthase [Bacteroidales bacterium]
MKIALAQLNYITGDFSGNVTKIIEVVRKSRDSGAELVVFAELAITGYPPRDFLEFEDFILKSEDAVKQIAAECKGIAAIVGGPSRNLTGRGKPLFNTAWFLSDGVVKHLTHKSLLPNYDVFDEYRYFEPANEYQIITFKGVKLAVTICEDIWNTGEIPLYNRFPMDELVLQHPDLVINIAASPFNYHQALIRKQVLRENALKYKLPVVYVNHVGAQTELIFDGGSMACDDGGNVKEALAFFDEDFRVVDVDKSWTGAVPASEIVIPEKVDDIGVVHDALVLGIRDYFGKLGFNKAILGLSGGIDSAVTMVLAAEALGHENVRGILLPSEFSSGHSIDDARQLAINLGSPYDQISIAEAYKSFERSLHPFFKDLPFGLAEENLQARTRAVILMAMSNKFGYILLNTSNKSEAAVGYGTLYGDMCGGLSVLGDVYKTEVYQLAAYINREREIIPENSITKPPSAELRPGQKDSDSLPDYELLDRLLYQYIEKRKGPRELEEMGFESALVARVLRMVNTNEWKRYQTPPILRVSPKAFGMGRRMPIVGKYLG